MEFINTILVVIVVALAVFYLFRHFSAVVKQEKTGCGCGECEGSCGTTPCDIMNDDQKTLHEKNKDRKAGSENRGEENSP